MLATAIEGEVAEWRESHDDLKDRNGHRQVVWNRYLPERNITTRVGDLPVRQPRAHDRRPERRQGEMHLEDFAAVLAEDRFFPPGQRRHGPPLPQTF